MDEGSEKLTQDVEMFDTDTTMTVYRELSQQELAQRIAELASPMDIANFFMSMMNQKAQTENHQLQAENQQLRNDKNSMEQQLVTLSNEISASAPPGTTFTCFGQLPPEIRVQILEFAMPDSRWIEMRMGQGLYHCPGNHHPSILHVNRETRAEILKNYPLQEEKLGGIPRFVNHSLDVLYISSPNFAWMPQTLESALPPTLPVQLRQSVGFDFLQLRVLALDCHCWEDNYQLMVYQLFMFPLLEELILVNAPWALVFGSSERGPWKMVAQSPYEKLDVGIGFGNDKVGESVYAKHYVGCANAVFGKELDIPLLQKQWDNNLVAPTVNGNAVRNNLKKNPWLATNRTPPKLRMMRMVPDNQAGELKIAQVLAKKSSPVSTSTPLDRTGAVV